MKASALKCWPRPRPYPFTLGSSCSIPQKGMSLSHFTAKKEPNPRDFHTVAETLFPMQGAWVHSLVGELYPTCHN